MNNNREPILSVNLSADYAGNSGVLRGVHFEVGQGEILGLVGQSGSGKSTIALSVLRLLDRKGGSVKGEIRFQGRDLFHLSSREMRRIRGREIGLVLQSPVLALNPCLKIGKLFRETWAAHSSEREAWRDHALEALKLVSLPTPEEFLDRYPRELSVGQAQRILIALAILHRPRLLIADEPTSALDAITQAAVIRLFRTLSKQLNMAVLFISHDLASVASLCDRVAILHKGEIVECGTAEQVFARPQHPYTCALVNAIPGLAIPSDSGLEALARHLGQPQSISVSDTSFSTLMEKIAHAPSRSD